jgi:elongator complex protein 3
MTEPMQCPGHCVYCPSYETIPRSYTPGSPAVLRARVCDYDARKQVQLRLKILGDMGHPTDKIELIVMGGTFLSYPVEYQYRFIKDCYDALNGDISPDLEAAKRLNQVTQHRCTGLCIETRPDWCRESDIQRMLEFGATRVELGVQMLDDDIYRLVERGHKVEDVVKATYLLRRYGFKVHYHWMPGLPGSTVRHDLELTRLLFDDARFRPDGLKLYPTVVVEGTELEKWYLDGRYRPYSQESLIELMVAIKSVVPRYVRISRILREIPARYIIAGCRDSLRGLIKQRMKQRGIECRCIRCREYGHRVQDGVTPGEPRLVRSDYEAADGREVLLSIEDDRETLFGMLRLRVQPLIAGAHNPGGSPAIVRELHVFGPEVPISEQQTGAAQHRGLGRALLQEAERVAGSEFRADSLAVLSGVGAREYYAESGYVLSGGYMVKDLRSSRHAGNQ